MTYIFLSCVTYNGPTVKKHISIIIPAYNEARTLSACLDTIAAQTVAPDEVIVVDNNSTDKTANIALRYPFVTLVHEKRQGIVFARGKGFDMARSELLARIDADTHLPTDWIESVQKFYAEKEHAETVLTGGCYFYNLRSGRLTGRIYDFFVHRLNHLLLGYYFPWGSNSVIPRTSWDVVRPVVTMRADVHEDLDLGIHLAHAGFRSEYIATFRVGAAAKRVLSDRQDLWQYLVWWPNTYRANGYMVWPLIWPLAGMMWLGSYGILANEYLLSVFRYKS
jgi:glycosyltransferase involved in cell wall biosynthesis